MLEDDETRVALRRETYDLKEQIEAFAQKLKPVNAEALRAVERARAAFFEAWTILCTPPDDDEDH